MLHVKSSGWLNGPDDDRKQRERENSTYCIPYDTSGVSNLVTLEGASVGNVE